MRSSRTNEYSCQLRKDLNHTFDYFHFGVYGQSIQQSQRVEGQPVLLDVSGGYPVSILETYPLVAHERTKVHGWFFSAGAWEALSHQSFAIQRSLKVANVTLKASSYLRVS
ncbi:hypothetical protein M9H77_07939 [Catharanthus roseus]|uniref:Uncharacterized protein n=1 Tax=Catharanthus roseus TaxID=4058 RepID=A0ACC0BWK0_CATRO|nr:hypothetical protein M9H77_07939 [Catharanthus roseus]